MRCYDGCPDSQLQALIDRSNEAKRVIETLGASVTYFPMEGQFMAFQHYKPISRFHRSRAGVAEELLGD
jgi:hypothetical protein